MRGIEWNRRMAQGVWLLFGTLTALFMLPGRADDEQTAPVEVPARLEAGPAEGGGSPNASEAAPSIGLDTPIADDETFALFPIGKPWDEVRVPRYNDRDELNSIMHAGSLTRQEGEQLQLGDLIIALFQAEGNMSLRLKTSQGIYDIHSATLRSRTQAFIEHQDFDMWGDRMEFDTKSQKGRLTGNVEMVIYNMERAAMPMPMVPTPTIIEDSD